MPKLCQITGGGYVSKDSESHFLIFLSQKKCSNYRQFQVEKAAEELQEAERQEVEARREAVALQEQIEKMIQVSLVWSVYVGLGCFARTD